MKLDLWSCLDTLQKQTRAVSGEARRSSGQVPGKFRGVPGEAPGSSGRVPGKFRGVPGEFRASSGEIRATPGSSGLVPGKFRGVPGSQLQAFLIVFLEIRDARGDFSEFAVVLVPLGQLCAILGSSNEF